MFKRLKRYSIKKKLLKKLQKKINCGEDDIFGSLKMLGMVICLENDINKLKAIGREFNLIKE